MSQARERAARLLGLSSFDQCTQEAALDATHVLHDGVHVRRDKDLGARSPVLSVWRVEASP